MALAVNAEATQTATIGTEHTLANPATSNVYALDVDCSALAVGEVVEIRFKKPVRNAGTVNVVWRATVGPSTRSEGIVSSPPVACPYGCTVTLKQINGTGRTFPWTLVSF